MDKPKSLNSSEQSSESQNLASSRADSRGSIAVSFVEDYILPGPMLARTSTCSTDEFSEDCEIQSLAGKSLDEGEVNCNSLLYRILQSDSTKGRDAILEIASFCEKFSLSKVFISLADVKKVLQRPSLQIMDAFDRILRETSYTKQIQTLDLGD